MHIMTNARIMACRFASYAAAFAVLTGCATSSVYLEDHLEEIQSVDSMAQSCRTTLATIEKAVSNHGRDDAGEQKLERFPYLRTNRLLAALSDTDLSNSQQQQLFDLLEQAGRFALQIETHNLPPDQQQQLLQDIQSWFPDKRPDQAIEQCSQYLAQTELNSQPIADYVQSRLRVDDHYKTWYRVVGLYYLTRYPVLSGVRDWHDEALAIFATPVTELPIAGKLQRYTLDTNNKTLTQQQTANILRESRNNPLSIPLPDDMQRQQLTNQFAPVFEIDVVSEDDRIGTPYWRSSDATIPAIDTMKPTIYTKLSHTVFNHEILLQLNYVIWFPSRPCQSSFDILCGHIDSIIWRVTLANDGTPLLFDSIHSCGCYHQFFPTQSLKLRDEQPGLQEPVLVPKTLPPIAHDERIVVRIANISHYIDAVTIESKSGNTHLNIATVPQQDYDSLRSMTIGGGHHRSLFDSSGLVPGTQRSERFILWPMGVPSPGAMRQWGTQATAFVGRRHFDEPCLIEEIFTPDTAATSTIKNNQTIANNIYEKLCSKEEQPVSSENNP